MSSPKRVLKDHIEKFFENNSEKINILLTKEVKDYLSKKQPVGDFLGLSKIHELLSDYKTNPTAIRELSTMFESPGYIYWRSHLLVTQRFIEKRMAQDVNMTEKEWQVLRVEYDFINVLLNKENVVREAQKALIQKEADAYIEEEKKKKKERVYAKRSRKPKRRPK